MSPLAKVLKKVLHWRRDKQDTSTDPESLQGLFRARYHSFRLLLTANSRALEMMSEMERAARGDRPFGMSFVRAQVTGVCVNVFRMIKHLDELAPGKYKALFHRFHDIQQRINQELAPQGIPVAHRLTYPLEVVTREMADIVGSKMANLGEVRILGLRVPPGFVISTLAYKRFMEETDLQSEIDRRLQSAELDHMATLYGLSASIQQLILRTPVPDEVAEAILEAYGELEEKAGRGIRVSMRSSALAEDVEGTSFAGQYKSLLNVSKESLIDAYKEILASKYGVAAIAYRQSRGLRDEDIAMCVGCMAMVPAMASGVVYSRNPLHISDDSIFINSAWGLPKTVVDGTVDPDLFVVARGDPLRLVHKEIRHKKVTFVCYPEEGVCRVDLTGEMANEPSISEEKALELAHIAIRLEEHYGAPQDIEWAMDMDGRIYILQCRPLKQGEVSQTIGGPGDPELEDRILFAGGSTASPGVGSGRVFWVRKDADLLRFPEGGVLVAPQAVPKWASVLGKAAAVVTEHGSITGHLANVAREFGVPALLGVGEGIRGLQDGMVVTVDADGRRVYRGVVEGLLMRKQKPRSLMEGSPVHRTLLQVMTHIIPLNLVDPDSPLFRPEKCQTLHDITRFCHEKSIEEMFSFGKKHNLPERASKQLLCEVPMQWWVLDLGDGVEGGGNGKFVRLEEIRSIPMLALWEGITAVPWEGPPPVDARGFMSVMVQATTNPALDPALHSPYANKNYFMISRDFCSLSSRFGFHFSVVEALVGERPQENYISFQFKGGAADLPRRAGRAVFVADILRRYGFRAEVKEDAVFARLDGGEEEFMRTRLKILGYLIIHTRQLDMVMANPARFRIHREKILRDLESLTMEAQKPEAAILRDGRS
jgi:pyruvate,water dikinase